MDRPQGLLKPFFAAALVLCGVCTEIADAQDAVTPLRIFKPDFRVTLTPEGKARLQVLENLRYRITHARSAEIASFDPSKLKPGDLDLSPKIGKKSCPLQPHPQNST